MDWARGNTQVLICEKPFGTRGSLILLPSVHRCLLRFPQHRCEMYVTELAFGQVLGYQIPIQFSNFVGVVNSQAAVHAIAAGSCGEFFDEW